MLTSVQKGTQGPLPPMTLRAGTSLGCASLSDMCPACVSCHRATGAVSLADPKLEIRVDGRIKPWFAAWRCGHDISLLIHPTSGLRYLVLLLFKGPRVRSSGVVLLESSSSFFNILLPPPRGPSIQVYLGLPLIRRFHFSESVSKQALLSSDQSFHTSPTKIDGNI